MDEQEWSACTDPVAMLEFLRGSPATEDAVTWWNSRWQFEKAGEAKDRRFRLFACACCRRIWERIPERCNRDAVAAVEDYLEGKVTARELEAALVVSAAVEWKADGSGRRAEPGYWAVKYLGRGFYKMTAAVSALLVASRVIFMADDEYGREAGRHFDCCFYTGAGVFLTAFQWPLPVPPAVDAERVTQAALLRCIFGNPFRPPPIIAPAVLAWGDGTASRLARAIYAEQAFDRLPVLADALEEAGCTDAELLAHLRSAGPHGRGCHGVDAILGKG